MKKWWKVLCLTTMISLSLPLLSFAGQWGQDGTGWWYQNTNGSFLKNGWYWVDDCCYFFNEQGYVLTDTVTPDGQMVNQDGAWTINGIVQTRPSELRCSTIGVKVPNGYSAVVDEDSVINIDVINPTDLSEDSSIYITAVPDESIGLLNMYYGEEGMLQLSNEIANIFVQEMVEFNAALVGCNTMDFPSGRWYHYLFTINKQDVFVNFNLYISYVGHEARVVALMGESREFTPDQFIMEYIR